MQGVVTIIQARTGSSRLPGKVLLPLGSKTVLEQMLERVARAQRIGRLVVATTVAPEDDPIVALCERAGVTPFRGHPTDLLDRHIKAWQQFPATAIVKIPSDCPLIDPAVIDSVINRYLSEPDQFDYVSNLHPQSYPDGNDVEVIRPEALLVAHREASRKIDREHTTPFLWDNPDRFRIANVTNSEGVDLSRDYRWTLDYPEDYEFICRVFAALTAVNPRFTYQDIVHLLHQREDIRRINEIYLGDSWYRRHRDELRHPDSVNQVTHVG